MGRALITKSTTKKAAPTLREKVVYAERSGWLTLMPWIQSEKSPYKKKQAFREMLHHDAVKAPLLQKIYSVSSLDIQATAASESPRDQEIAGFAVPFFPLADPPPGPNWPALFGWPRRWSGL